MKQWVVLFIIGFILFSCNNKDSNIKSEKSSNKTTAKKKIVNGREVIDAGSTTLYTGKPGQLLIVSENTVYTDEVAAIFDSVFNAPIRPYYPPTPYFEVYHKTEKEFKKFSTSFRNVIEIKLDEKIESGQPKMIVYENYYSSTQLYTKLLANNMSDLYQLIQKELSFLFTLYDNQEWKREYYRHLKYTNESTQKKLQKKFGIELTLPRKYRYESVDDTYAILIFPERTRQMDLKTGSGVSSGVNYIQSGLMIWQYPYTDTAQLNPVNLIKMRDTILKKYAKHEMEGVYMGTQYHPAVLPVHQPLKIGDVQGYQIRGLYKFTGKAEPSGGRFWGFQFKHPYRNTIVAISGYIDVPPTMSPNLDINIIRSIIYSLKVVE